MDEVQNKFIRGDLGNKIRMSLIAFVRMQKWRAVLGTIYAF